MSNEPFIEIPTWKSGAWSTTSFSTRESLCDFLVPLFKEPGQYKFDDTSYIFNQQARIFNKTNLYCAAPFRSRDYTEYWDDQKYKCRNGVIYHGTHDTWYLPREYYMWLNYLPIFNKEIQAYGFADVRDAQYHMALYETLAELHHTHSAILKKRQIASSYYHAGKLINQLWFEEGITLKMGASLKDYVNELGTWKFYTEYKNFLDEHTAWYRPMNPGKIGMWQQQIEVMKGNRKTLQGNKGTLQTLTFEKSATKGVGGPCRYFFYEEAGIAPTMDITVEYLFPAMKSGHITTGMFIAAGSVGDLAACEPLKRMIEFPVANSIYPVKSNLLDEKGTIGLTGLFIPEQHSMPPYIDEFGNSKVEEALKAIDLEREIWKKDLSPEQYQLRISQHPKNIAEAFASREVSIFPPHLITAQLKRIEEKEYPHEHIELSRNAEGILQAKESRRLPIMEFPVTKRTESTEGVIVVWERPVKDPVFGTYYASIDPIGEGKTTTSDSLCAIYVMKTPVEVTKVEGGNVTNYVEQDKIVASWCGRFDDLTKTHELLEMLIEWYNAWTLIENNVSLFIQHMIFKKKQRYLIQKDQILFLKDIGANQNVYQAYGWKNTGSIFKTHFLSYSINYLLETLDQTTTPEGDIVKTTYGVERIPDPILLKEMAAYTHGLNVDRLVAFSALVAFSKMQQSNRGFKKKVIDLDNKNLEKSKDLFKLKKSAFTHMGNSDFGKPGQRVPRNAFKNLR
jgi:hypothetical protein